MQMAQDQSVTVRHDRRASLAGFDARDFSAFDADPGHQAFLVEDKSIGIVLKR